MLSSSIIATQECNATRIRAISIATTGTTTPSSVPNGEHGILIHAGMPWRCCWDLHPLRGHGTSSGTRALYSA